MRSICVWMLCLIAALPTAAASIGSSRNRGPYNVRFLEGGIGLTRPMAAEDRLLAAGAPWSMYGWMQVERAAFGSMIIGALGDVSGRAWQGMQLQEGRLALVFNAAAGSDGKLVAGAVLEAARWYAVAATFDGAVARLYLDGREIGTIAAASQRRAPLLELAPVVATASMHFGGALAGFAVEPQVLSAEELLAFANARPDFALVTFNEIGVGWPWQEKAWRGLQEPQDPWTLPKSHAAASPPVAVAAQPGHGLLAAGPSRWTLKDWHLSAAPNVMAPGAEVSSLDYREADWYAAVVPGTVLTTLIARGVYPDPDYGLNNLAIPESLNRQDYWYRTVFDAPSSMQGRELTLTFQGINYSADVWLNGERLGAVKGAFIRGSFNVTGKLHPDRSNVIAVRIAPPPHPGIPHEQSIAAGPGMNGGNLAIDGPTFVASEGWDWIPAIRDRNSGIWQDVELQATGVLRILDPHVVTRLPLPRTDSADISMVVPLENRSQATLQATVSAIFDAVTVHKTLSVKPGVTEITFEPSEFPQLHLTAPRLWWPNGYGPANLHHLDLQVSVAGLLSDSKGLKFGIRELTYELSLFDSRGRLRRVEVDPALGSALGQNLIDVRHRAIKRTPTGWAESLTAVGENSPAVRAISTQTLTPYLAIRVNGVPIAARGGSWGMDDSRKRVARERLEPYFQLHRAAHLNIIRNWLGQNTEEVFYDLADEYGLLVLNDFWASTQDFQVEPQDPALFLANARDVISRYRNHPSIAVWFGRNEGVPQPIINEGLSDLTASLDGTRYYTGSSNSVNLQGSGPYNYRPPVQYFTDLARGFSVEVGTPSLSTIEALRASIPDSERWPLSDTYAYHDWHFGGNGDVATFMDALAEQYGVAENFEDFERKAQLMNYVSYRAIFEGFQAHLWTQNSGRLLWMTHPSWPSNTWQIYSSDYDTAAAYFAVKKACETVHAQLNLPDYSVAVTNISRTARSGLTLRTRMVALDNRLLAERVDRVSVAANSVATLAPIGLERWLNREELVLVKLTLSDAHGKVVSDNLYWQGRTSASQRRLNDLPQQPVELSARVRSASQGTEVDVVLTNRGAGPALNAKITMLDAHGDRVLPVDYEDNFVGLLSGESRRIVVNCAARSAACAKVALRGWNVQGREVAIKSADP